MEMECSADSASLYKIKWKALAKVVFKKWNAFSVALC